MLFFFLANRSNDSFLSPITCIARDKKEIIPYLHKSINKRVHPCFLIVLTLPKALILSKPFCLAILSNLTARMSQKSAKISKNKHGVRVMGLKSDSSASTPVSKSSALVEHQETLNLQPLQHEPPLVA